MNSRGETLLELQNTKLEIHRTREEATQSWLDSRPIIDHLEDLKSTLAASNGRISMANSLIFDLHSNLESTHLEIQAKKAQQIKTHKIISQLNQDILQTRNELEQIKQETDERPKLKQTLGVKKQSLKALRMKLRAVKMESRGFEASEKDAIGIVDQVDVDSGGTVRISLRDYELLRKRAEEEGSIANRRVIMVEEQRAVAKAMIEKAMMRLKEVEDHGEEKGLPERDVVSPRLMVRSVKNETKKMKKKKKKKSMLVRIKNSLVKKLKKWFG